MPLWPWNIRRIFDLEKRRQSRQFISDDDCLFFYLLFILRLGSYKVLSFTENPGNNVQTRRGKSTFKMRVESAGGN